MRETSVLHHEHVEIGLAFQVGAGAERLLQSAVDQSLASAGILKCFFLTTLKCFSSVARALSQYEPSTTCFQ